MSISRADNTRFLGSPPNCGEMFRVGKDRQAEAIGCLLADQGVPDSDRVEQFLTYSRKNRVDLDLLWARVNDQGRMIEAVLVVPNPGRTAMFFASGARSRREAASIGALLNFTAESLDPQQVHLAQSLTDPAEPLQKQTFLAGGFSELARLSYLERRVPTARQVPPKPTWPGDIDVVPYCDALEMELLSILEATYAETLDCPALRGLRDTRDILTGHRSTGDFTPGLWTILRSNGTGVGAILLNPSPAQRSIELVYLGLAPEARGRALGRKLLHHGLRQLAGRSERTINLAVDERNTPALKLYESEGFRRALRRIAMIRSLRTPTLREPEVTQ